MKTWSIKHKPTNTWMPSRMSRSNRGWSHWNPGYVHPKYGPEKYHDTNPRIFFTLQSARNALTMWLQGVWEEEMTRGSYFEPPESAGLAPNEPPAPRRREDMEIVELELVGA